MYLYVQIILKLHFIHISSERYIVKVKKKQQLNNVPIDSRYHKKCNLILRVLNHNDCHFMFYLRNWQRKFQNPKFYWFLVWLVCVLECAVEKYPCSHTAWMLHFSYVNLNTQFCTVHIKIVWLDSCLPTAFLLPELKTRGFRAFLPCPETARQEHEQRSTPDHCSLVLSQLYQKFL